MTRKLHDALKIQKKKTKQEILPIAGSLGVRLGGQKRTEVPNRNSYVYVQLRDNPNEVVQAFNNKVAPSYGLPVILRFENNRYTVEGVDTARYQNNWNSFAPYLPRHGNTHSFDTESGGGGDITWVQSRQFMPALILPSGSSGGPNVILSSYTFKNDNGSWKYIGITGTSSLLPYIPSTGTQAVMVLVYLDATSGNPYLLVGSGSYFSNTITGSSQITPYIPSLINPNSIPLAAVRLVSGTSTIGWDNIYDVRQFIHTVPTGTGGGGGGTGSFDSTYLRLDTSNDPLTEQLQIIPNTADLGGLYVQTKGNDFTSDFEQYASSNKIVSSPVLFLYRAPSDGTAVKFTGPMLDAWQIRGSGGDITGSFIRFKSDGTDRFYVNPSALSTGTNTFIDGDFTLGNDGNLLLLANHGSPKTKIAAQGNLEFGLGIAKEPNAGKIGYNLFSSGFLEIVGAGPSVSNRWVLIYDKLRVNDHFQTNTAQTLGLLSSWVYANATGTFTNPFNAPDISSTVTGSSILLGTDPAFNSGRLSVSSLLVYGNHVLIPSDGWIPKDDVWTRTGNHTFTVVGDVTVTYRKNTKVRYKDGGSYEYGVIQSSSYSAPITTVTLITNTNYAMAAATITDTYLSYIENPEGFPDWFDFTPGTITGWGASPPASSHYKWRTFGEDQITFHINQPNNATSTTTTIVFSLPVTAKTLAGAIWVAMPGQCVNNSTVPLTPCYGEVQSGGTTVSFYLDYSGQAWTAANNKRIVTSEISYRY